MREFSNFNAPQMCDPLTQTAVVIKLIPFAIEFKNGMMGCPSHHRIQNSARIVERSVWIVSNGITYKMSVAGGVRKIILAAVFMNP